MRSHTPTKLSRKPEPRRKVRLCSSGDAMKRLPLTTGISWGFLHISRKGIFQRLLRVLRGCRIKHSYHFCAYSSIDMRISEVQVNSGGAEPVMTEYFLDGCQ